MLRPAATKVVPTDDYQLIVTFTSGEQRQFDVKPYIKGSWYGNLKDVCYFKAAFVNGYTVEWPDGQDLCPDELYYNSEPICPVQE